jgi:hypothetical protein
MVELPLVWTPIVGIPIVQAHRHRTNAQKLLLMKNAHIALALENVKPIKTRMLA